MKIDYAGRLAAAAQIAFREPRLAEAAAAQIESTDPELARLIRAAIARRPATWADRLSAERGSKRSF